MKAVVLASGSEGNSTFFSYQNEKILLDIGKNAKYIKEKLLEIEENPQDITAILISHTHDDHVSALRVFLKSFHPKVYVTEKMFYDLECLKDYPNVVIYDDDFYLGPIKVNTIRTSHDASDSRNFILTAGEESLVYLTDTGYLNRKYFPLLENKNIYYIESNHDEKMLMDGPYPYYLKQRIISDEGHLSNDTTAKYLKKLVGDNTKYIILAHLSEHNNKEEIAYNTSRESLKDRSDIKIVIAKQSEALEEIEVYNEVNMCR